MHQIFQRTGIPPDEVMAKPRFVRTFLLKSMEVQLEAERDRAAALAEARKNAQNAPRNVITRRR